MYTSITFPFFMDLGSSTSTPPSSHRPHHLKGLSQGQREHAGHLLLSPASSLEGIAHHRGAGEVRFDMEGDVSRIC